MESARLEDPSHLPAQARSHRPSLSLAISVAIVVAVIAGYIAFLARYATNGVYWDEWNWVGLMHHNYNGTLTFASLWAQHTENRMLFPNIVVVTFGDATGFSDIRGPSATESALIPKYGPATFGPSHSPYSAEM